MAIPDFQACMLPTLRLASDGKDHHVSELRASLAALFQLDEVALKTIQPSGRETVFGNRVGWAKTYLSKAKLVESTGRGLFRITQRGRDLLAEKPKAIDRKSLERYPEFVEAIQISRETQAPSSAGNAVPETASTPEELLEEAYLSVREQLRSEVLERLKACSPQRFERLVVDLLVRMGYGGTLKDAAQVIGKSGDGGIDGTIKEDRLGLDVIYIQAKRWGDTTVGRTEIQKFVGALQGQKARKGIFLTTSKFCSTAREYADRVENKVILIDGDALADLMIDYDAGVTAEVTYTIKRLDHDFFDEEP